MISASSFCSFDGVGGGSNGNSTRGRHWINMRNNGAAMVYSDDDEIDDEEEDDDFGIFIRNASGHSLTSTDDKSYVNTGGVLNSENGGKCGLQALLLDHRQNGIIGAHHHRNPFDDDDELALDSPPTMIKSEPPTSPMLGFHGGHHLPQSSSSPICGGASTSTNCSPIFMDSMGTSNGSSGAGGDAVQLDIYRDLIIRHLIQDITATCAKLSLPTNPYQWSADQSGRWIDEMAVQFQLSSPPRHLCLAGRVLCAMNQEEFLARAPNGGDTLHAQLQLWKTAAEQYHNNNHSSSDMVSNGQLMSHNNTSNANMHTQSNGTASDMTQLSLTDFLSSFNPTAGDGASAASISTLIPTQSSSFQQQQSYNNSNLHQHHQQQQQHHHHQAQPHPPSQQQQQQQQQHCGYFRQQHPHAHHSQHQTAHPGQIALIQHLLPSPAHSDPSDSGISGDSYAEEDMDACGGGGAQIVKSRRMPTNANASGGISSVSAPTGNIHLWQFIRELLDNPNQFSACVRWLDRKEGIFKIESSHQLARLWGQRKNRTKMNYDKLSRSLRQYYKKNIIKKTGQKQRLIYQFIPPYHFA